MPEIITRAEAKACRLKRYFTGKPCKHGHVSERKSCDGKCIECSNDFQRKYLKLNPEKRSLYYQRARKYQKEWRNKNREKHNAYGRRAYWRDIELTRTKAKLKKTKNRAEYQRKWRNKNREKYNESQRIYRQKNIEKFKLKDKRFSLNGPKNPKGEIGWLRKNQAQLRTVKRIAKDLKQGRRPYLNLESMTPTDLHR